MFCLSFDFFQCKSGWQLAPGNSDPYNTYASPAAAYTSTALASEATATAYAGSSGYAPPAEYGAGSYASGY